MPAHQLHSKHKRDWGIKLANSRHCSNDLFAWHKHRRTCYVGFGQEPANTEIKTDEKPTPTLSVAESK
jgi:hypothetical protein